MLPGFTSSSNWEWCYTENSTYLDCPIDDHNSNTLDMMVAIHNPSTLPQDYVSMSVPHGFLTVEIFDHT